MTTSIELQASPEAQSADADRVLHVARFITAVVATGEFPAGMLLPQDPSLQFVVDDPTGHFPLQVLNPTRLGFDVGTTVRQIYAIAQVENRHSQEIEAHRSQQAVYRGSLRPDHQALYQHHRSEARRLSRETPAARRYVFRASTLEENLTIIRPASEYTTLLQKYGKIGA